MFADFKDNQECKRYVEIMLAALKSGVKHPKLLKSQQGYFHTMMLNGAYVRLVVMEYIDGNTFYDLNESPTKDELLFLANQAALINKIDIKPPQIYDSWAVVNFVKEFEDKKGYLEPEDLNMINQFVDKFKKINITKLPHSFVHGDIIKTNVIRSKNDGLYVIDFFVSNYYPRIQELAVLFCDLFFNQKNPETFSDNYKLGLDEYQKYLVLTQEEIDALPLYTIASHAMHIINPIYEQKAKENKTIENAKWLELGRLGLKFALKFWKY